MDKRTNGKWVEEVKMEVSKRDKNTGMSRVRQRTLSQWSFARGDEDQDTLDRNRRLHSYRAWEEKQIYDVWGERRRLKETQTQSGTSTATLKSTMDTLVLRCQQTCTVVLPRWPWRSRDEREPQSSSSDSSSAPPSSDSSGERRAVQTRRLAERTVLSLGKKRTHQLSTI